MDFNNERKLKARKEHKCFLCNTSIDAGDTYIRWSGKYEGDFFDLCLHTTCKDLIYAFIYDSGDSEYDPVWVRDWIIEEVCSTCSRYDGCCKNLFLCSKVINCLK